jgi:hydroxymethylpyrimidine pyrophosphatase-like HAD family hydrolase
VTVTQITPKGVDKGRAITDLCKILSPSPKIIIGCGDDNNDLPLFEKSHLTIAIENAPYPLLAKADMIVEQGALLTLLKEIIVN